MPLHHVNFHTLRSAPIFEQAVYDTWMRAWLMDALVRHAMLCPVWELMPTHVHLILLDFDDYRIEAIVKHLKGASAHDFFQNFPELRADFLGGHLWTKGYFSVLITSHRQYTATLAYITNNRAHAGLEPPTQPASSPPPTVPRTAPHLAPPPTTPRHPTGTGRL